MTQRTECMTGMLPRNKPALTLTAVKRASILLLIAAAAGVVAAFLSRENQSDPPESWSPVEPS